MLFAITPGREKRLIQRVGQLTGKPESSKFVIHPAAFAQGQCFAHLFRVSTGIQPDHSRSPRIRAYGTYSPARSSNDIIRLVAGGTLTIPLPVPSDCTILRVHILQTINCHISTAGDWVPEVSKIEMDHGPCYSFEQRYEVYDRLSASFYGYLEALQESCRSL